VQVIYDDDHAQENPSFQCEPCYEALHYDVDRNLIYSNFKQFSYEHD